MFSTQDKRRRGRRRTMSESSGPLGPPERAKAGALASANISGNQASTINNNNNNISKDKEAKRASYQSQMSQRSVPSPPKVCSISLNVILCFRLPFCLKALLFQTNCS